MAMTGLRCCLIDLCWLNVWNGCYRVGPWRAARTFACIATRVFESADYWRPMQYQVVCNLTFMRYFAVQINNTLQWWWRVCVAWLTFVGWMYGTGVVLLALLDKQYVRLLVLLCACVLEFEKACIAVCVLASEVCASNCKLLASNVVWVCM